MQTILDAFQEVWAYDFEFYPDTNLRPVPLCMVAVELKSGRVLRLWHDELSDYPFSDSPNVLHVSYNSVAEISCHLVLGWPVPARVLDLYTEFRCITNQRPLTLADLHFLEQAAKAKGGRNINCSQKPRINSLLSALNYYGLPYLDIAQKTRMRDLILSGGPWSAQEKRDILDYCAEDVTALASLLPAMAPHIDLPRALYRGRYMRAVARMEHAGIPADLAMRDRLTANWEGIQRYLIDTIGGRYGVYEGINFKANRFERYLAEKGWPWPRHPSGALALDRDTFKDMARVHPELNDLHELRNTLGRFRLNGLTIGADGRNRTSLFPFKSKTSRNQPSNAKFLFGPATWMRGLIKPPAGFGVAYIDYAQQEWGIAAVLSGDEKMREAYSSSDPYLTFAKQAGAVPDDATKQSHGSERSQFKQAALAVQYGMEAEGLAARIGQPAIRARELLDLHRRTYSAYWRWADGMLARTLFGGKASTVFGWTIYVDRNPNARSLQNFPIQAHGAEMMRLAACLATEQGIEVVAPVHDAFLIVAPLDGLEERVKRMQECMGEASRVVLDGFEIKTDTKIIRYPDRYMDEDRGAELWSAVQQALSELEESNAAALHPRNTEGEGSLYPLSQI